MSNTPLTDAFNAANPSIFDIGVNNDILQNPNNPVQTSNSTNWFTDILGNVASLFDNGAKVYADVISTIKPKPAAPATTPVASIMGVPSNKFLTYAALGGGVLLLIMLIKRR